MKVLHVGFGFRPYRFGGLIAYAEDLMDAQVERGHEVAYLLRGRSYPGVPADRLHRWTRRGVRMLEILNSSLVFGGDAGTRTPELDVSHPPTERHLAEALDALEPDVVHLQELIGLPTSLIDVARARAVPVVMTLQDYFPLCPTLKLYDVDDRVCLRHDVGAQCARCCAAAAPGDGALRSATLGFEVRRRLSERNVERVARGITTARRVARRPAPPPAPSPAEIAPPPGQTAGALRYQARRDMTVERLSRLDAALAMSTRVREIYAQLGVDARALRVLPLTLRHIERLQPKTIDEPPDPVHFTTLNGLASVEKGREVVLGALAELRDRGLSDRFRFTAWGYLTPETEARLRALGGEYGGYYDAGSLDEVMEPFHVGVVPSIWEEAFGYVGVELLAKGLPVIGNARGGIVDYVRDEETGWLNHAADAAGLAGIMAAIVDRPEQVVELNRRIRAGRERIVKSFDPHVAEIEEVYASVCAAAGRRLERLREVPLGSVSAGRPSTS